MINKNSSTPPDSSAPGGATPTNPRIFPILIPLKPTALPATVSHTARTFPFGEEMAAQHAGGDYATRYKFNGKELDPQTGYYYYGARYYDPVVSRWLSIDPLAEKFAGLSPYNYVFNNPLIFIDPTGKGGEKATDEWIRFSTGEVVRVGDKGGDKLDYITVVNEDGSTYEVIKPAGSMKESAFFKKLHKVKPVIESSQKLKPVNIDSFNLIDNAIGTLATGYATYAEHVTATSFKSANNLWKFHTQLRESQRAWRLEKILSEGYGEVARPLGKYGYKIFKGAKMLGPIATGVGVGYSLYKINNGTATTIDYVDATVGLASLGATLFLASNPIGWAIGVGAGIYFAGRLIYDIYDETTN